jgi:4-hydroxybenzoate polyprenyltransferase
VLFSLPLRTFPDPFARLGGANILFALTIVTYIVMMTFYSIYLKHLVLIDVFIIAIGFVLRIFAGAIIIAAAISPWLYLVTCFLSLFLAFSKRRHELVLLQEQAGHHRLTLKAYNVALLDQIITIVVTGTILSYSIYTIEGPIQDHRLIITIPFVLYGVFRYLYLIHLHKGGGSPEEVLLRDPHIRTSVLLCGLSVIALVYFIPA